MALLAPDPTSTDEENELELLIREARRRQRRRRFVVLLMILAAACGGYLVLDAGSSPRSEPLLARPLHFPSLAAGGGCPASSGYTVNNSYFTGMALGGGPVRVLLADRGDILHGRVELGGGDVPHWFALQTLWFAMPGYGGPFVVRGARLGARGPIEVQPGGTGLAPGTGPLVVSAGPTINTQDGYRAVPGSTWVKSPGCYAWQIDGTRFTEVLVVNVVAAGS